MVRTFKHGKNMLNGSMFASQAFANAPVGHEYMHWPILWVDIFISHGHSNALVLTEVLKFNANAKAFICRTNDMDDPYNDQVFRWNYVIYLLIILHKKCLDRSGLTLKLNALNVPKTALSTLAQDAMLQTRLLQNNPRDLNLNDAEQIYHAIYA